MSCMSQNPFVSRIEFIRSKLSNCSAHVAGVTPINRVHQIRRRDVDPYLLPSPSSEQLTGVLAACQPS